MLRLHGKSPVRNRRRKPIVLPLLVLPAVFFLACTRPELEDFRTMIDQGEFSKAKRMIENRLAVDSALGPAERLQWKFEIERIERISKDFTRSEDEVTSFVREVMPDVTDDQLRQWEASKALEFMMIDGEKRYFNRAARNLFRIDREAGNIWNRKYPEEPPVPGPEQRWTLDRHIQDVIETATRTGNRHVQPRRLRITQTVEVKANAVPDGEVVRCWIPFPREILQRQEDIWLVSSNPQQHVLADNSHLQRTVYMEKPSQAGVKTRFEVSYEYTSYGFFVPVEPSSVRPAGITPELQPFLAEEPPHIVFTPELKDLSREIVGDETNPYAIARKLFEWVDTHIPWASAREYSTIRNIPRYGVENRHGDCGIQSLLFITLCRMNGIPARWQSGWEFQPPDDSMHDWCVVYFEPYGWVPVDVTYGLRKTENERLKWFFLSGMDSYRLIFNDGYSQPFYPVKVYPRSETVDSQRGEVEWRGGNLYFDQWDRQFKWETIQ